MFRIPHIRAVSNDKRLTPVKIEAVLAMTSLAGITRRAVADAFRRSRPAMRWSNESRREGRY